MNLIVAHYRRISYLQCTVAINWIQVLQLLPHGMLVCQGHSLGLLCVNLLDLGSPLIHKIYNHLQNKCSGAPFLISPGNFQARKAIFSSSVPENGEVYVPKASCMKGNSVHNKNMWIKQFCNFKVQNFALVFQAWKVSRAFEKWASDVECVLIIISLSNLI